MSVLEIPANGPGLYEFTDQLAPHVPASGALNIFVAYGFSEETWVSYKLYSAIGFTLALTILTALMISPYIKEDEDGEQLVPQDDKVRAE